MRGEDLGIVKSTLSINTDVKQETIGFCYSVHERETPPNRCSEIIPSEVATVQHLFEATLSILYGIVIFESSSDAPGDNTGKLAIWNHLMT